MQLGVGNHKLRASKPGYETLELVVEVEGGTERRVSLQLVPEQS